MQGGGEHGQAKKCGGEVFHWNKGEKESNAMDKVKQAPNKQRDMK